MSPTKLILAQMQESEKNYYQETVNDFSEQAINLNLCKNYLKKIMDTTLNKFELRNDIQEFLNSINKK